MKFLWRSLSEECRPSGIVRNREIQIQKLENERYEGIEEKYYYSPVKISLTLHRVQRTVEFQQYPLSSYVLLLFLSLFLYMLKLMYQLNNSVSLLSTGRLEVLCFFQTFSTCLHCPTHSKPQIFQAPHRFYLIFFILLNFLIQFFLSNHSMEIIHFGFLILINNKISRTFDVLIISTENF